MKINKSKLVESVLKEEDLETKLDSIPETDIVDVDDTKEIVIAADIVQGGEENDVKINPEEAVKEAEIVKEVADLIVNPYGTAKPSAIERSLQRSLNQALRNRRAGIDRDYPNVLLYGLAGFGKTSIVEKFCKDHNIFMFECDAKTLDTATVGGIPYPTKNKKGETIQKPISSEYWEGLNAPNVILFLDELNRAKYDIIGTLLTLINNHKLPMTHEDPVTGETLTVKKYPNILFTVTAINPASDIFDNVVELDPAVVSRHGAIIKVGPNIPDFYKHIKDLYSAILAVPTLVGEDRAVFEGQFNLATALLNDRSFEFDSADDVRNIYLKTAQGMDKDDLGNYLNYRTFLNLIMRCDGTKADFLDIINHESHLQTSKRAMYKNILSTYTDKVTTGNQLFTSAQVTRSAKTRSETEKILDDFLNSL